MYPGQAPVALADRGPDCLDDDCVPHLILLGNSRVLGNLAAWLLGANRWPASSRMQEPLSIGLSTMATASLAYSFGLPMRLGNAASLVSTCANSSGIAAVIPVLNRLGAIDSTRMPRLPRSRAMVRVIPAMPAFA